MKIQGWFAFPGPIEIRPFAKRTFKSEPKIQRHGRDNVTCTLLREVYECYEKCESGFVSKVFTYIQEADMEGGGDEEVVVMHPSASTWERHL